MAPKRNAAAAPAPPKLSSSTTSQAQSTKPASTTSTAPIHNAQDAQQIVLGVWNKYLDQTPQRVKLLDVFMGFLLVVGVLQFVYCVIAGNYVRPFTHLLSDPPFIVIKRLRLGVGREGDMDVSEQLLWNPHADLFLSLAEYSPSMPSYPASRRP